ncbi:hypothetical protein P175DRAFT_0501044 [Aspergillus ochraceoroseus IBT 24754]|uniref:Secreted protein n=1 Tax=Aspergillus ochraceoroseus IBT 24754 TaxID=1392256 RepID=A0A2T5M0Y2_9EURO|nr:uncharacterized protein P175DRAFT_0501044 [Aspergillus ochraceoroseus IBT 24754]PTU22193.1 hypothetical protein P175DRAFT_0501044 [Aspergillus ochraceoroseus IBT 24754]
MPKLLKSPPPLFFFLSILPLCSGHRFVVRMTTIIYVFFPILYGQAFCEKFIFRGLFHEGNEIEFLFRFEDVKSCFLIARLACTTLFSFAFYFPQLIPSRGTLLSCPFDTFGCRGALESGSCVFLLFAAAYPRCRLGLGHVSSLNLRYSVAAGLNVLTCHLSDLLESRLKATVCVSRMWAA